MMSETINFLGTKSPKITVSENRIEQFSSILNRFNFNLENIYPSYYLKGKKEYSFNGEIEEFNKNLINHFNQKSNIQF